MDSISLRYLIVTMIIFFVCREIMCWYFKQSEIVKILNKILLTLDPKTNETPMNYPEYKKGGK